MGTIDYGAPQLLTFDYNQDATAKLFNGVNFKLTPTGIYEGFTLTRTSNSYISVSVGTCFIQDSDTKTGTRITTGSAQQIQVTSATPYIILRFDWIDSPNNYMDMLAVAYESITSDDLIVGRCIYDDAGTTLSTSFDYTRRSNFYLSKQRTESSYLKVAPTEPYSKRFVISSGVLNSSKGNLLIAGITFGSDIPDTINGRNDLVWIDENGVVQVLQGTDSSSPVTPRYGNRKVVAEIRRGAARTSIRGNEVIQVITSFDSAPITSDLLITDAGNLYSSTNVESALQEIAGSTFAFSGEKTFNGGLLAKASQTITGLANADIQTLKKSDGTVIQRNDLNGKLINTVGSEIAFLDTYSKYTTDKLDSALNQIAGGNMTIAGVKTFSDGIQANVTGNVDGNALYSMNFDLVVDSDAKLAQWAASGTWEKVLIKKGTWTLASGGVDLTARGTKCVIGEPESKLVFSSAEKGLYYTTAPTTKDYRMDGVTVTSNGVLTSAFYNCSNLYNCTANGVAPMTSAGQGFGFNHCLNIFNCIGNGVGYGDGFGFEQCNNVISCKGVGTAASSGVGFKGCKKCQQNTATGTYSKYVSSYADAGTSYACADTPNGGFNS